MQFQDNFEKAKKIVRKSAYKVQKFAYVKKAEVETPELDFYWVFCDNSSFGLV